MAMPASASPNDGCIAKPPPPPLPPPAAGQKATYSSYNGHGAPVAVRAPSTSTSGDLVDGTVAVLRGAAAVMAFVALALVASCRHGDWMEFTRYQEYRYLVGVCVVALLYSSAQALRHFRRRRHDAYNYNHPTRSFLHFAADQVVAYLLITAASAALPITIRMRSAVVNVFTDAIAASIALAFLAFAALAASATLNASAQPYY